MNGLQLYLLFHAEERSNSLSNVRSPVMDTIINSKYEALTVARAAAGFPERVGSTVYNDPEALDQHPHLNHDYQELDNPDDVRSSVYSGKYISMKPCSSISRSMERGGLQVLDFSGGGDDPNASELTSSQAYDDPTELDHHGMVGVDIQGITTSLER